MFLFIYFPPIKRATAFIPSKLKMRCKFVSVCQPIHRFEQAMETAGWFNANLSVGRHLTIFQKSSLCKGVLVNPEHCHSNRSTQLESRDGQLCLNTSNASRKLFPIRRAYSRVGVELVQLIPFPESDIAMRTFSTYFSSELLTDWAVLGVVWFCLPVDWGSRYSTALMNGLTYTTQGKENMI